MENAHHLARLKQGVDAWNQWRKESDGIHPFLREADLSGSNLSGANLSKANLHRVNLSKANFSGANLRGMDLRGAKLGGADLSEASLIDAHLYNAILTGSCLFETQRAGWSIKGAHCESVFFDRNRKQETHFAAGEFERLYAESARIVLHYEGGINPIEVATLPALIQRLEKSYEGCKLRLRSIQDDSGGATVTIVVDDLGHHALPPLREAAEKVQQLQLKLREEENLRLTLEGKVDLMRQELFPLLERAMGNTYNVNNAYGPVGPKGRIKKQTIYNNNDLADIRNLVDAIGKQHANLEKSITNEKLSELQQSLRNLQDQLTVQTPDHSIIQSSLQS